MEKVDWKDPELVIVGPDIGGGNIYHYKRVPFTGFIYENFSNGNLEYEFECKNGYPDGVKRNYHENGQIADEGFMKFNQEYGVFKEFDELGELISTTDFGPEP